MELYSSSVEMGSSVLIFHNLCFFFSLLLGSPRICLTHKISVSRYKLERERDVNQRAHTKFLVRLVQ